MDNNNVSKSITRDLPSKAALEFDQLVFFEAELRHLVPATGHCLGAGVGQPWGVQAPGQVLLLRGR